LCGGHWE
jgi:hypothetical protein